MATRRLKMRAGRPHAGASGGSGERPAAARAAGAREGSVTRDGRPTGDTCHGTRQSPRHVTVLAPRRAGNRSRRPSVVQGRDGRSGPDAKGRPRGVFQEIPTLSDEDLVARCRDGDERAWSALVRRHAGSVYRIAHRAVRRTAEAEDLSQEIFVKVSLSLDRYDSRRAFRPWLLQVARNHVIDHHRSRWREKAHTIELDALPVAPGSSRATQEDRVLREERRRAIDAGLAELPEGLRDAVVLRDLDGLDYAEIAQVLDVPVGTVKSRFNRGRLQLARSLADRREDLS